MRVNSLRRLLIIGYVWPEPCSSAAGSHMLSLLRMFQDMGWEVHYASPAARGQHEVELATLGVQSEVIRLNCASFDQYVAQLAPTAVLFDRFMMEEQFGWRVAAVCPQALRLLDMEDMHSLRRARQEAVKKGRPLSAVNLGSDDAKREVASIFRCDLTLVISEAEYALLESVYEVPRRLMVYCPFLLSPYEERRPTFEERAHFISIGNFRHAPNWDAVLQLKQGIWADIRRALPKAELHVYGAYVPPKAMQLHNEREGFLVKGWAHDAREVIAGARVLLAPLRFGAGLKGKLTEAMLCGTPSITTAVGVEGILPPIGEQQEGHLDWSGVVVEEVRSETQRQEFVAGAVALYQNATRWEKCQRNGEQILAQRFDPPEIRARVQSAVLAVMHDLAGHRAQNFIGAMLQHQSMKATQYMAQWIEEKNR